MSDNWVVQNLQNALDTWNKYLSEIWQLITKSPEQFKGGSIWGVMRQFIFSVLACGVAVGLYFILRPYFGVETLSWMCILGAAPFAMLGFITYHGMTAEQFIWAWLRSEMLEPKEFKFEDSNYYYAALKDTIEELQTGRPGKKRRKEPKHFSKRKEAKHD